MPDLIGKTIGSYRIVSQIGLGGMATVFKAYQPSMDRYVALKVLSTHLAQDTNFIKRFQQEAKIIAKLEHLHILPVYDHGEQDGYLYLVMRFIEAGTLKDRLKQGPLSLDEARRVVQQVGSALEYAHQLGVIHRDMKPSNILVDPQGDCYLTDFGIAKIVEGTLGLTGSGIVGTPHYMAPEQSRSHTVDHRADIYAMGVVIYEMVTGQLPYDAETPFAVVMKHISEPLPLPRAIRPDLPEAVERVILRALAKDPADRYQSMRDLVTAFDQAVQTAPDKALAPHVSPAREPAAAPALTPTVLISRRASLQRRLAAQPAWLLPAAGLALVVMVLAGVILSRIPGRVEIAGGQLQLVTPTAAVASQAATPASAAELVATPMPTPQPRVTPIQAAIPTGPCRIANVQDDGDIYVRNCDGSGVRQVTFLKSIFGLGQGPLSWSPDGQTIVFQSTHERQPGADPSLYLIKSDGSNLTRLTFGDRHDKFPAWSPDGRRIAFHRNCTLVTIAPDGSDAQTIVQGPDVCPNTIAWSPDGQQLAFASWHGPFPDSLNFVVYVVNSNGSNLRKLGKFKGGITPTWSPDSKQIGVEVGLGQAEEAYLLNADGSGEPVKVPSIPTSWHNWYWPQWDGKAQVATSPASPMAGQARALAEPILKAIADRPPDFQDDFSTAGKGWGIGGEPKEGSAIQDGVARLRVNDGSASLGNEALNRKDFVLQVDARVAEGDKATQLSVNFHNLSSEYWFYVVVNSTSNTWLVDKHVPGDQRNLVNGRGNVSPFGEMTRVMIVARGARAAVYLNDTPVAYFEDADFDTSGGTGLFCQSLGQVVCEFDNVKLWRLESVPGLPSAGSLADQARAFAEPILKTIANRKPDFADDFSTPDKGWSIGTESQGHEGSAIQGGVARLRVYDGIASYKNTALNRKDFVLQTDARVAEGDSSTHLLVTIHVAAAEYWFNVELNSRHGSWIVRKKWGDQQTDLVTGIGNVSPLGEWTRIMILARGPQAAIYFNGTPIAYFEDADFDRRSDQTVLHCQSILQAACEFDNVKFWNLANVPGLP